MNTPNSQMEEFPFLPAVILLGATCLIIAFLLSMQPKAPPTETAAVPTQPATEIPATPTSEPTPEPTEEAAAVEYDPALVSQGQSAYMSICIACHGMDARGIPGLGKDLLDSEFVHGLSDQELADFIIVGRRPFDEGNTTGIDMPARGGNPTLTDEQIHAIVAYLRTEAVNAGFGASAGGTTQTAGVDATTVPAVVQQPTTAATAAPLVILAPGEGDVEPLPPAAPRDGETAYNFLCAGCHGASGEGTPNNGSAITNSDLLADDDAMTEFLTRAEPIAPLTDEFVHPARGGYPPLTDEEIQPLIDYMHALAAAQ